MSMTVLRRSVPRASLKNWLPQALVRSTGQRLVFWIGAATPSTATFAANPKLAQVAGPFCEP